MPQPQLGCPSSRQGEEPRGREFRALFLWCLQCTLALRAELRLIVFQALLRLLTLLTLAQLLDLGFARLFSRARASLVRSRTNSSAPERPRGAQRW
jgi:hypothetical protein